MSSPPAGPPLLTPPYLGGWTRSMLIELADRRTERRGSKTLDLNSEFLMALQHLCMERRWTWRRKVAVFMMRPGQWQYDLTLVPPNPIIIYSSTTSFTDGPVPIQLTAAYQVASTSGLNVGDSVQVLNVSGDLATPPGFFNGIFPITAITSGSPSTVTLQVGMSPGLNGGATTYTGAGGTMQDTIAFISPDARDLQQFVKHGVKCYPNTGNLSQYAEITPLFERDLQTAAIYKNRFYPQPNVPQQYFIMPGAFLVLCLVPAPNQAYPITIDYWACPNFSWDSVAEQIPLVPAYLHHVLLKRLEAQIFRYTLGEGAAKYQAAMGEYNALVAAYSGVDSMVPGEHIDWSEDDDYASTFANAQNAVQSTT